MLENPVIFVEVGITGHFSPVIPSFTNRGLSCRMTWSASEDDGWNYMAEHKEPAAIPRCNGVVAL
jgi:hypothetical protein